MGFNGEALLAPRPTLKLEDHPSSAVRECLFNLFVATLHIGGRSSTRNLWTRHALVKGTHITRADKAIYIYIYINVVSLLQPRPRSQINTRPRSSLGLTGSSTDYRFSWGHRPSSNMVCDLVGREFALEDL